MEERVGYTGEQPGVDAGRLFDSSSVMLSEKFKLMSEYMDMVAAGAFAVELDKISELQTQGVIGDDIAQQLRQNVYVLQMNAESA